MVVQWYVANEFGSLNLQTEKIYYHFRVFHQIDFQIMVQLRNLRKRTVFDIDRHQTENPYFVEAFLNYR